MRARLLTRLSALAAVGLGLGAVALAQPAKAPPPTPAWDQTVTKEPDKGLVEGQLDAAQLELVQKITAYFNQMGEMQGTFIQLSPDNKRLRGKIFVKRPGFFRFEYNRPSRQLIISDSKFMIVQDHDLNTEDRWGLEKTPFRIILRKDVDLLRDAKVLEVGENTEGRYFVTLQDKDPDTPGRLQLQLAKEPELELKGWITTDSQGLDTRVELTEFVKAENLDPNLFVPPPVQLRRLRQ